MRLFSFRKKIVVIWYVAENKMYNVETEISNYSA